MKQPILAAFLSPVYVEGEGLGAFTTINGSLLRRVGGIA